MRALIASGIPVTVSIGDVERRQPNARPGRSRRSPRAGSCSTGASSRSLAAPGVSVPTSEPGRGDDGDVRFGTISGTSAAAAVTAGVAARARRGRPAARRARARRAARRLRAARSTSTRPRPERVVVDLRAAVQQEAYAEPSLALVRGRPGSAGAERDAPRHNVSTRRLAVSIANTGSPRKASRSPSIRSACASGRAASAEVVVTREHVAAVVRGAAPRPATLVLRAGDSPDVHVPWAVAVPAPVDLVSHVRLRMTGTGCRTRRRRRSRSSPARCRDAGAAGAVGRAARACELWRGDTRLGVLARRRELLPGPVHVRAHRPGPDGSAAAARDATRSACSRFRATGRGSRSATRVPYRRCR